MAKKRDGFTLVELLVVIAIIALLVSILLPALGNAKAQARHVICQTHLKSWGTIWLYYTEDNDGKFPSGFEGLQFLRSWWAIDLDSDLGSDSRGTDIYKCAAATEKPPNANPAGERFATDEFTTYQIGSIDSDTEDDLRSSYGLNCWIYDSATVWPNMEEWAWARIDVKGASNVPLLLDSKWRGSFPLHTDRPIASGDLIANAPGTLLAGGGNVGEMVHFQMKRHNQGVNSLFLDYSVRSVMPIELWELKWHKEFDISYFRDNTAAEEWMN